MNIKTGKTNNPDVKLAVRELKEQLLEFNVEKQEFITDEIVSVIFFASVEYDSEELINSFNREFAGIVVFGASSKINICDGKYLENSIVAMVLTKNIVQDVKVVSLDNVEKGTSIDLLPAIKEFSVHYGGSFFTLPKDVYFGVAFMTFATRMETILFDQLQKSTKIQFTGATAAAKDVNDATFVYANGKIIRNGALLALFKVKTQFNFDKIDSVVPLPYKYVVSEIDNEKCLIKKLDGVLGADALCNSLDLDVNDLRKCLDDYLFGSFVDGIPYLCSILEITEEGYISVLRNNILLGTTLGLFKNSDNIVKDTSDRIQSIKKDSRPLGLFQFQCAFRYNYLQKLGQVSDYENLFSNTPNIGFCTFGEYYVSYVNNTSTLLIFNEVENTSKVQSTGQCYELMQVLFKDVAKESASNFSYIRTKLILKGINPDIFGPTTLDNPRHLEILWKFTNSMRGV